MGPDGQGLTDAEFFQAVVDTLVSPTGAYLGAAVIAFAVCLYFFRFPQGTRGALVARLAAGWSGVLGVAGLGFAIGWTALGIAALVVFGLVLALAAVMVLLLGVDLVNERVKRWARQPRTRATTAL